MADKVLIMNDDPSTCKLLEKVTRSNDLRTTAADSGQAALHPLKDHVYDIILVDVILRDTEGFEIIRTPWNQDIKAPIMIISGRNRDYDSLHDLSVGADDYIIKPFHPLMLGAKVKTLIRRSGNLPSDNPDQLEYGPLSYNASTMRFYKDDGEIFLSSKESSLVLLFMKHPGQVFTKEMIYEHVWGNTIAVDDNVIVVYIGRLRSKTEGGRQKPAHIMTVRGLEYRFAP